MNSNVPNIKTTKIVYPQIYSYSLPEDSDFDGSQKIGYTERRDVKKRIFEQTHTAAIKLKPSLLWSAPAYFKNSTKDTALENLPKTPTGEIDDRALSERVKFFKDKEFHRFLKKNGIENRSDLGTEWYYFNGTPEKSKELFDLFTEKGNTSLQDEAEKILYSLRSEQEEAVSKALEYFNTHECGEFLWNAKPRFGKTLASYDLAKRLNAQKVLIVTNRPAIANSWFDDFEAFVSGYKFISTTSSLKERKTLTREQYLEQLGSNNLSDQSFIAFLSLQDLKGSRYFVGDLEKLRWVADMTWDLLVVDEAHEGVDTTLTDAAFDIVKRNHTLHLSGTPFKALANNKFPQDAIFNWTYLDEQEAKQAELNNPKIGEGGSHTDLPDMCLYTYRISEMTADIVNEGIEIDEKVHNYAFDLNEFFAVEENGQKFIHEEDVKNFLENLSTNTKYPFSTPELRAELKHTFWFVGNRVASSVALAKLLKEDPIFKDYKVIVAAGKGKDPNEEENNFDANEKSFDKVKKAIAENDKTITLSCGQLTTGVTIPEWSAVLMLTDIKSPALYMQAAFRAQNPHRFFENGNLKTKKSAYLFDFAPARVLRLYDEFANGLNREAVNGEITEEERRNNIKELLNFFPVISEDRDGQMVELDAEKVLTFPNALAAVDIVKARFMTNLLFNDNIKNVFSLPKEVEEIINKLNVEKNKKVQKNTSTLDLDDAKQFAINKEIVINDNKNLILSEKVYGNNLERKIDDLTEKELNNEKALVEFVKETSSDYEPVLAKYQEVYKASNSEVEELRKEIITSQKVAVEEFINSDLKDREILKNKLKDAVLDKVMAKKIAEKENKKVETIQKSKEEEIKDRLRSFTRTIPMFVMANSSLRNITIDNFDEEISETDFEDLTNITKDNFHKLRDGYYYEENGERKFFGGVFDKYRFNASIAEFLAEKQKRADYFSNTSTDIFELIPNQKNNQIFTPRKVVTLMLDSLEKEAPEIFKSTTSTFIDLYMKSGMYITETVKRLFTGTRHFYNSDADCVKHILENQVFGLAPTGILDSITKAYIFGFDEGHNISTKNFVQHDLLPEAKDGTAKEKLYELFNLPSDMKFTAVVGNPPYQVNDEGSREDGAENASASPIYHLFVNSAKEISNLQSLIMPARWLSGAGKGLTNFTEEMLESKTFRAFSLFQNSKDVFPNVDIKGGVCFYVNDNNYNGKTKITVKTNDGTENYEGFLDSGNSGVFIPFKELINILEKVKIVNIDLFNNNLQDLISVLKP